MEHKSSALKIGHPPPQQESKVDGAQQQQQPNFDAWAATVAQVFPIGARTIAIQLLVQGLSRNLPREQIYSKLSQLRSKLIEKRLAEWNQLKIQSERLISSYKSEPWTCFICNCTNSCANTKCRACTKSYNPLFFPTINLSQTFCVPPNKFGVADGLLDADIKLTHSWQGCVRVVVTIRNSCTFEIVCKPDLSKKELCQIIVELHGYTINKGNHRLDRNQVQKINGKLFFKNQKCVFFGTKDSQLVGQICDKVASKRVMLQLGLHNDFTTHWKVRRENMMVFEHKVEPKKPCPQMLEAVAKNPSIVPKIDMCDIVNQESDYERVLSHLEAFDHFKYFGVEKEECKEGRYCTKTRFKFNTLATENSSRSESKVHDLICAHPRATGAKSDADGADPSKDLPHPFEFLTDLTKRPGHKALIQGPRTFGAGDNLFKLISEVIDNGFEKDLLPKSDQFDYKEFRERMYTLAKTHAPRKCNFEHVGTPELAKNYSIFEIVEEKMQHPRHVAMGRPFSRNQMLAMILYTDGECNYNMCLSQRSGDYQKWKVFDALLAKALVTASQFEEHHGVLYSGLCGVQMDLESVHGGSDTERNHGICMLKSFQSFSFDLQVAKEFAGDKGMIIGVKMKGDQHILKDNEVKSIWCCDLSWISNFPSEKEVLFGRRSYFKFNIDDIQDNGIYQLIAGSEDPFEIVSIADLFPNEI